MGVMICAECRQALELSFGQSQPEPAVAEHLAQCAECRALWTEMSLVADSFKSDDAFELDSDLVEQMAREVDRRIDLIDQTMPHYRPKPVGRWSLLSWSGAVPAAAAVLLVLGMGLAGYWLGRWDVATDSPATTTTSSIIPETDQALEEPDELTVELLLDNFTSERRFNASESLLDDITEEEMNYLEKNFDIGAIL